MKKIIETFKAKNPLWANWLQKFLTALAGLHACLYAYPETVNFITPLWAGRIAVISGLCAFLLQFTKSSKQNNVE